MAVVLITGAGSGFGMHTALACARRGDTVYAASRNPDRNPTLQDLAKNEKLSIQQIKLDVKNKTSITQAVGAIKNNEGRIDILINNAGIHIPGAFEDMPEADIHNIMDTNFFAVLNVTRAVLPLMRERESGRIIMISSVGAMLGRVNDSIYCASKSALEAASEALRYEVAPFGIKVSVLEPGVFKTEIGKKYEVSADYPKESPYRELIDFRVKMVKQSCQEGDDPERIADLILDITAIPEPDFRYPAGKQAEDFLPRLQQMNQREREDFIRTAAKIDWWLQGQEKPE